MSVEIANVLHAACSLNCANVADSALLVKGFGFAAAPFARASAGVYNGTLLVPLGNLDGFALCTPAAGTSVTASVGLVVGGAADNLAVRTFTHAGVAADIGELYIGVFRYPVI